MAVDHWWLGTTSSDPTVAANWSTAGSGGAPGVSVPGTGNEVQFDGGGNNPCTLTAHWTLGGLTTIAAYTAKLDLATFNLTMDDGASVTLDGGGEFDCGTGSHSMNGAGWTLDNKDQTTWTRGTSHWTLNGTGSVIGHFSNFFYHLTTAVGSEITIDVATQSRVVVRGTCTINGAVILNQVLTVLGDGDFVINEGASFSGNRYLYCLTSTSGHGLTTLHSSVTVGDIQVYRSVAGTRLAAGTYGGLVKLWESAAPGTTLELDNGTYNFNGGLELENSSTGVVTLQNKTNVPTINVTDLMIDTDSTGTCVIDDDGAAVDWTITGDAIDQRTGDTFTWTRGTGTVTFSGSANQDVDLMGENPGAVEVDKSAGTLTLSGAANATSFTGTSTGTGDFDPNGQTITITGNCSWAAAFDFNSAADTMNGCTWIVGGNFTANGQTLNATAIWTLSVTGTAVASGTGSVQYSNASAGTKITATAGPWTDGGNNENWEFIAAISNIQIGGWLGEEEEYLVLWPDKNVRILI